jgi:hypothetical protein
LEKVTFGEKVTTIGNYAFFDCSALKNVVFPDNVNSVGKFAFGKCAALTGVVVGDNVTTMGGHVFYRCENLTLYVENASRPEGWNTFWNSSYRPVVWGCEVTAGNERVVSVTISEKEGVTSGINVEYANELKPVTAPYKAEHTFVGWSTKADATTAEECEYGAAELVNVPVGTKLYAIWKEGVEEPEQPPVVEGEGETA